MKLQQCDSVSNSYLEVFDLFPEVLVGLLGVLVALKGHIPRLVVGELAGDHPGTVLVAEEVLDKAKRKCQETLSFKPRRTPYLDFLFRRIFRDLPEYHSAPCVVGPDLLTLGVNLNVLGLWGRKRRK